MGIFPFNLIGCKRKIKNKKRWKDMSEPEILSKLDIIIKLLATNQIEGKDSHEQILFLSNLGIANKNIAEILGKTQNTVNATLSQLRKKKNE